MYSVKISCDGKVLELQFDDRYEQRRGLIWLGELLKLISVAEAIEKIAALRS